MTLTGINRSAQRTTNRTLLTCVTLLIFADPAIASAQTPAETIRASVAKGERISVRDDQGRQLKGRFVDVTAEDLTVLSDDKPTTLRTARIATVERQKDSLLNGSLIGLGVGLGLGILTFTEGEPVQGDAAFCGMAILDDCGGQSTAGGVLTWGVLGTLIGAWTDFLIHRRDLAVYRRPLTARVSLAPSLARRGGSALVSVSW